jgi:AP-3 complex subunit delta-1
MLDYQFISNFEWYVSVLVELAQIDGSKHGSLIASQMMDVTIRVDSIRSFSVRQMSLLLQNHHLLLSSQRGCSTDVLFAAAWICGEFSEHLGTVAFSLHA